MHTEFGPVRPRFERGLALVTWAHPLISLILIFLIEKQEIIQFKK